MSDAGGGAKPAAAAPAPAWPEPSPLVKATKPPHFLDVEGVAVTTVAGSRIGRGDGAPHLAAFGSAHYVACDSVSGGVCVDHHFGRIRWLHQRVVDGDGVGDGGVGAAAATTTTGPVAAAAAGSAAVPATADAADHNAASVLPPPRAHSTPLEVCSIAGTNDTPPRPTRMRHAQAVGYTAGVAIDRSEFGGPSGSVVFAAGQALYTVPIPPHPPAVACIEARALDLPPVPRSHVHVLLCQADTPFGIPPLPDRERLVTLAPDDGLQSSGGLKLVLCSRRTGTIVVTDSAQRLLLLERTWEDPPPPPPPLLESVRGGGESAATDVKAAAAAAAALASDPDADPDEPAGWRTWPLPHDASQAGASASVIWKVMKQHDPALGRRDAAASATDAARLAATRAAKPGRGGSALKPAAAAAAPAAAGGGRVVRGRPAGPRPAAPAARGRGAAPAGAAVGAGAAGAPQPPQQQLAAGAVVAIRPQPKPLGAAAVAAPRVAAAKRDAKRPPRVALQAEGARLPPGAYDPRYDLWARSEHLRTRVLATRVDPPLSQFGRVLAVPAVAAAAGAPRQQQHQQQRAVQLKLSVLAGVYGGDGAHSSFIRAWHTPLLRDTTRQSRVAHATDAFHAGQLVRDARDVGLPAVKAMCWDAGPGVVPESALWTADAHDLYHPNRNALTRIELPCPPDTAYRALQDGGVWRLLLPPLWQLVSAYAFTHDRRARRFQLPARGSLSVGGLACTSGGWLLWTCSTGVCAVRLSRDIMNLPPPEPPAAEPKQPWERGDDLPGVHTLGPCEWVAGVHMQRGWRDARTGHEAQFNDSQGIAVNERERCCYVCDHETQRIRRVTLPDHYFAAPGLIA